MKTFAIYELASGLVVGSSDAIDTPPPPPGHGVMALDYGALPPIGETFVQAGQLQQRKDVVLPPVTVLVGESVAIPIPAGVGWLLDGAANIGPKTMSFATAGNREVILTGGWRGSTTIAVMTATDYQASLIDQVKAEAERRRMLVMSTGGSKKTVYAAKAAEVENWNNLGAFGATVQALMLVFNGLNSTVRARKFRFAIKDAASHGDTVDKAIARFTAGADACLTEVARIEGIEQAAVDRIKAATTRQAKLAAFNTITWTA